MAKPKKPAARKPAAKPVARAKPAPDRRSPFDDKKPDAPATAVVTHARNLARQVRVDLDALTRAKVTAADADQSYTLAAALDAAQDAWLTTQDARNLGSVAAARGPLREGRDQLFAALRTFADANPATQATLDAIGGVDSDDDLTDDTTRLLALAKKHRKELDGTDVTPDRLSEVRAALDHFAATRGGARSGAATTAQAESEATRSARRVRNRAFWTLASLDRQVSRRGQYAFRDDAAKRTRYGFYRRNPTPGAPVEGDAPPSP